ncbi:hypothetical protein CVT24_000303 [Panaeolus cyanescens]|uniref:Uncharacterized protein n=1 Tax=Panaeolus cyanescens TaxID=181874 RepID=A0A409WSP9_9AGAR|nr:hypothetical protein CVT24_000303 [Panaeolus cyanescens]
MVAAAGFNARHPESYFVSRSLLDPPMQLVMSIFLWVEREQQALRDQIIANSRAEDDAAVLFQQTPNTPIWKYQPFSSSEFRNFLAHSTSIIQQAEESARQSLSNLPANIANSFKGSMVTAHTRQLEHQQIIEASTSHFSMQLSYLGGAVNSLATLKKTTDAHGKEQLNTDIVIASAVRYHEASKLGL